MNLLKHIVPLSILVAFGSPVYGFADDSVDQLLKTPSLSSGAQSFGSSLGSVSRFGVGNGWLSDKWQGQSSVYKTKSLDIGVEDTNQWSVDITRRFLSSKQNTYLAMGLGWNDVEVESGEVSSGMRFIAEGRFDVFGPAFLFGQASLSPWMSNVGQAAAPFGKELAFGLAVEPLPSMSLRAGYRGYWLDSTEKSSDSSIRSQTDGLFIGGGLRW